MKNIRKLLLISLTTISCLAGCKKDEKEIFEYVGAVAPYLHEIVFDDYVFDTNRLTVQDYTGSCSVVRNGNFVGRNFD